MATTTLSADRPAVTSWRSFTDIIEESGWDEDTGEAYKCTKYVILDEASNAFVGEVPAEKLTITLDQAASSLRKVPDHEVYPRAPADLSLFAPVPGQMSDIYIKRPKLVFHSWYQDSTYMADKFLVEAQTHELIRLKPHPNVVKFEGCLLRDGLIVGLALQRYHRTLMSILEDDEDGAPPSSAEVEQWLHDIRSAVDHLHSLGVAHNDINPRNIMQDDRGNMILVDLGSCTRLGEELTELGTPGWNEGFTEMSSKENDEIGQRMVERWLRRSC